MRIGLLGGGRQARETAETALPGATVAFAAVQSAYVGANAFVPLVDLATTDPELLAHPVTVAVGAPLLRRRFVELWGGTTYHSVVAPSAVVSPSARLGEGTTVQAGAVVSTDAVLGDHSHVNLAASLSHDVRIGRFSVVAPGARLLGGATLGDGVFVGAGAVVLTDVVVAEGCVIAAGAVVLDDTEPLGVYVGAPAQRRGSREDWLDVV